MMESKVKNNRGRDGKLQENYSWKHDPFTFPWLIQRCKHIITYEGFSKFWRLHDDGMCSARFFFAKRVALNRQQGFYTQDVVKVDEQFRKVGAEGPSI